MLKFGFFSLLALTFAGASFACDIRTEARADGVADYLDNAQACLSDAPDEFRYSERMEQAFIRLINEERTSRGLNALVLREDMRPAARFHSLDMGSNGFFGHVTPRGRNASFRISAFDRTLLAASTAENVAKLEMNWECRDGGGAKISCAGIREAEGDLMAGAVQQLHDDLMVSPGHRDNILAPNSTHIALGVARTETGVYVTQLFAQPVGEFDNPVPPILTAGSTVTTDVTLTNGFSFKRFALLEGGKVDDLMTGKVPNAIRGERELAVRGEDIDIYEDRGTLRRTMNILYIPGPAVTIVEPDASTGS
ncbi:MAG: CAP domain-containing protein [Pseudomonadota bacterium]